MLIVWHGPIVAELVIENEMGVNVPMGALFDIKVALIDIPAVLSRAYLMHCLRMLTLCCV